MKGTLTVHTPLGWSEKTNLLSYFSSLDIEIEKEEVGGSTIFRFVLPERVEAFARGIRHCLPRARWNLDF